MRRNSQRSAPCVEVGRERPDYAKLAEGTRLNLPRSVDGEAHPDDYVQIKVKKVMSYSPSLTTWLRSTRDPSAKLRREPQTLRSKLS